MERIRNRLLTVALFCKEYKWPSESAMRAYIYRANENGLAKAFFKIGKRVLINPDVFFDLVIGMNKEKSVLDKNDSQNTNT